MTQEDRTHLDIFLSNLSSTELCFSTARKTLSWASEELFSKRFRTEFNIIYTHVVALHELVKKTKQELEAK